MDKHDFMCKCHADHREYYKNPVCEQMHGCKPVDVEQTDDRNLANWLHALPDSAITNGNAVEYWRAGFRFNKALTLVEAQAAEITRLRDKIALPKFYTQDSAKLRAEIKRLRDALKAKIDSYEYDTSFYEIQEGLEALLKEQDKE